MSTKYLLSIGIISYNRPIELVRTIKSLLPLPSDVEILICDDKSPKIIEIESAVKPFCLNPQIRFISNKDNLGYDKNLFNVIKLADSGFVLLLGDDDYMEPGAIQNVLKFINKTNSLKCAFLRYVDQSENKLYRNFNLNKYFHSDIIEQNGAFIYNSILFSGLIFEKTTVVENENIFQKYFNSIYIQVSIFTFLCSLYGVHYIYGPGVVIGGDGESGFGFNESSSEEDKKLKDRSSIISNLAYHKRLLEVLYKTEQDIQRKIIPPFIREYKLRSVKAIFKARSNGREYLKSYWKSYVNLKIDKHWQLLPVYLFAYSLPSRILLIILTILEKIVIWFRKTNN